MTDREFLLWLRDRLVYRYHESPNVDFVHKLNAIIQATPIDRVTPNVPISAEELSRSLR
jgi:hypothetical protein